MSQRIAFIGLLCLAAIVRAQATRPASQPTTAVSPAPTASRIIAVTVYQGTALVTREVAIPAGLGLVEVTVTPLPPQTIDSSLYTEGGDGVRVLSTRYRTRAVKEDTRAEVRALQDQIKKNELEVQRLQSVTQMTGQNLQFLSKLENFTTATMQSLSDKGMLNGDATLALTKYVMDARMEKAQAQIETQQKIQSINESSEFARRQLAELAAGASREERDAVIVVDKANGAAGTVRLNYLVSAANWHPQYKLRAGGEKDPVQVEYLAAILQQSGEDWRDAEIVLSTAQPMLSAAPPELLALDVAVGTGQVILGRLNFEQQKALRTQAQSDINNNRLAEGSIGANSASALQQTQELLARDADAEVAVREGPTVTYHLKSRLTIPSRNDEQLIEVARIELEPEYFYKAVPVLSPHVYRLANLLNKSEFVLLPGEATMYQGRDFVGRMNLPLVAVGEQFIAGFGVDPQLQAERKLLAKTSSVQGGNQVHIYDYRIRISSFKREPVKMQVWDRLPRSQTQAVAVTLLKNQPDVSPDPTYQRVDKPDNLMRWDLTVEPGQNGEKALTLSYQFKLEYERTVNIGNFKASELKMKQ